MRYLKTYKLFESLSTHFEIMRYLEDIFLELKDEGFNIKISTSILYDGDRIFSVMMYKTEIPVSWSPEPNESVIFKMCDVLEIILTAESYMKTFKHKITHIEATEIKDKSCGRTYLSEYNPSIPGNPLKMENPNEMFTLKIEFSNKEWR